jgi:ferredoxin-NADP reductase
MWQFDSEVAEIIQRTPSVKSFRFKIRTKNVRYRPGQFFFLTIKVHGEDAVHHFSFSSSPTDKGYIEFTGTVKIFV